MADPYARFLVVFATYTQPDEWITAARLANRIMPRASPDFAKEVSRKLSNLNRFGHLDRQMTRDRRAHEYRRQSERPITLPVELKPRFAFGQILLPDPSLDGL